MPRSSAAIPAPESGRVDVVARPERAARLLHPTRRRMVSLLNEPSSAAGLARQLGLPRQQVNYHLRELERAQVVQLVEERRKGNCTERLYRASAHAYVIDPDLLRSLGRTPGEQRDRFSTTYLIAAAAEAVRDVAAVRARAETQGKRVATMTVQCDVRFRSATDRHAFGEALATAVADLVRQFHDEEAESGRLFRLLVGCYPAPSQVTASAPSAESEETVR